MKTIRSSSALLALALLAGCSANSSSDSAANGSDSPNENSDTTPKAESNLARNLTPDVATSDAELLRDGNAAFAVDLYSEALKSGTENVFYSPHSISIALAMAYAGARTSTETQIASALHFTLPQDKLHPAFNQLDLYLKSRAQTSGNGSDGKGFRLNVANSIWGSPDVAFQSAYLDTLAVNYGASVRLTDFGKDPEAARLAINGWVDKQTEEKIKDLIPKGALADSTRLVLVNAIYFNAAWQEPFSPKSTKAGTFHGISGDKSASMMEAVFETSYSSGAGWRATSIPYEGGQLTFNAILPDNLNAFEASFTAATLNEVVSKRENAEVDVTLPKFKIDGQSISLKGALASHGMTDAFDSSKADFSGINGDRSLFVSEVVHKAFVNVDEAGTEAAAATGVIMGTTAAPANMQKLTFDKPFIFFVRDEPTGAILFVGRVGTL